MMATDNPGSAVMLTVTDLKQWLYCPRVAYYVRCLPSVRPTTYRMRVAKDAHEDEEDRERRRSLRTYGLNSGDREFDVEVSAGDLGLRGKVDLVIRHADEIIPVEYKDSDGWSGRHFQVQLAAYGILLERSTGLTARRGFLYFIPSRSARAIDLDEALKGEALAAIAGIQRMIAHETMPDPTPRRQRCPDCEFRRFCNDVI